MDREFEFPTYAAAKASVKTLFAVISFCNARLHEKWIDQSSRVEIFLDEIRTSLAIKQEGLVTKLVSRISTISDYGIEACLNTSRPSVKLCSPLAFQQIGEEIFGDLFCGNELIEEARTYICQAHSISFTDQTLHSMASAADALNKMTQLQKEYTRLEVLNILVRNSRLEALFCEGFIELLLLYKVMDYLEYAPKYVRRRGHVYFFYLANRVFGRQFHILGLDFLFEDGLLVRADRGLAMLISGEPGTGKTTLALHMAVSIARTGGCALYFTPEQDVESLLHSCSSFNWIDPFRFYIPKTAEELAKTMESTKDGKGFLFLSAITKWKFEDSMLIIRNALKTLKGKLPSRRLIVIDSLNALRLFKGLSEGSLSRHNEQLQLFPTYEYQMLVRDRIEQIFHLIRKENFLAVLCSESGHELDQSKMEEYLADVVIDLKFGKTEMDFNQREMQIKKCRTQHVMRGNHHFVIERERGIEVYPSCSAVLDARKGREKSTIRDSRIATEVAAIRNVLPTGILQGSISCVIGEAGSGKSIIVYSIFLSEESPKVSKRKETYLLISLGEDDQRLKTKLSRIDPVGKLISKVIQSGIQIEYLSFNYGYISAGNFLSDLVNCIGKCKRSRSPISRILIRDLAQLDHGFPALQKQKMFLPTLCDIFLTEEITGFFSCSTQKGGQNEIAVQLQSVCDYVFVTSLAEPECNESPRRFFLSVVKSIGQNHDLNASPIDYIVNKNSPL